MSNKHKHYDVIIAYAEGKRIQFYDDDLSVWRDIENPSWLEDVGYRIKPEHKPDIRARLWSNDSTNFHLTFVFDGETKAFKTVEYHDE